jgi:hypothetical protein
MAGRSAAVTTLCAIAALSVACSATPPSSGPAPITTTSSGSAIAATASPTTAPPTTASPTTASPATASPATASPTTASPATADAGPAFTVAGDNPVTPNGSQDTDTATPDATCDGAQLRSNQLLGASIASGFSLEGFPAASDLLRHFLSGTGTEIDYRLGSTISNEARASAGFAAVNELVQGEIAVQLKGGDTRVRLSAGQLPTVLFASTTSDLYWGFRGTQGLTVSGGGRDQNGRYVGTLTYVIRDSYGFPVDDTLDGFGPPMRYLQTACGAPRHPGGARWFPDTITVRVPFNPPA